MRRIKQNGDEPPIEQFDFFLGALGAFGWLCMQGPKASFSREASNLLGGLL